MTRWLVVVAAMVAVGCGDAAVGGVDGPDEALTCEAGYKASNSCPAPVDVPEERCSFPILCSDGSCTREWVDPSCLRDWCEKDPSYASCGTR
jgi:hypothetical protein